MKDRFGVVFMTVWCLGACGLGLWILIWPEKYWAMWKRHLDKGGDVRGEPWFYLPGPDPVGRGRKIGGSFLAIGIIVSALFWRVYNYGPFGQ